MVVTELSEASVVQVVLVRNSSGTQIANRTMSAAHT